MPNPQKKLAPRASPESRFVNRSSQCYGASRAKKRKDISPFAKRLRLLGESQNRCSKPASREKSEPRRKWPRLKFALRRPGGAAGRLCMISREQAEFFDSLDRAEAYDPPAATVERIDTHASSVFLAGPSAYKVK